MGSHQPHWLERTDVPLFVSQRTLGPRKSLPRARGPWALDSGGFSELSLFGEWRTSPQQYVAAVRRYQSEIGNLEWAAIQDWMCEPWIIQKTGLSIVEHQQRTIDSLLTLRSAAPEVPWTPVIQGFHGADYQRHMDAYMRAGVDLTREPLVGIGSVCRRKGTTEALDLFRLMSWMGLRLHGFGLSLRGLVKACRFLASSDTLAWSYAARRRPPCMPGHTTYKNGANCLPYALHWRTKLVGRLA